MTQDLAYKQLLTLISARSQQWLRNQIELLPLAPLDDANMGTIADIAVTASVCEVLRKGKVPLTTFIGSRVTPDFIQQSMAVFGGGRADPPSGRGSFLRIFAPSDKFASSQTDPLEIRLALSDRPTAALIAEVEQILRHPVPFAQMTDRIIARQCELLSLCYCFGADRPRFSGPRVYGEVFENCLRLAEWASGQGRLLPVAQMIYGLCLIDPDFDVMPMLSDAIASQRPDGSFPLRIGFGTTDQDIAALQPTLAMLVALHIVIYGRRSCPQPMVPLAA